MTVAIGDWMSLAVRTSFTTSCRPPVTQLWRRQSTKAPKQVDIDALLKEPSWSVRSLFEPESSKPTPSITKEQLHHLLRLSALPAPKSEQEEARLIKDLQAQLRFVQAIQEVDTEGIEPLQSIRDETDAAKRENTITMETLKDAFAKEEVVGKRGRIFRKKVETDEVSKEPRWDPLQHAPKRQGRYFIVDTAND